jgi:CHAT domain-containing protein
MIIRLILVLVVIFPLNVLAKVNIDERKFDLAVKQNDVSYIYNEISKFKNIKKISRSADLSTYKSLYERGLLALTNAAEYRKIYQIIENIFRSKIFSNDKEFIENKIYLIGANAINKELNCSEKTEFILNLIKSRSLQNPITEIETLVFVSMYFDSNIMSGDKGWECNSKFFKNFLLIEYENLIKDDKYKLHNALIVTEKLIKSQGNRLDKNGKVNNIVQLSLFINFLLRSNHQEHGIKYLAKIDHLIDPFFFEKIIIENEEYIFDIDKNTNSKELIVEKLSLLGAFIVGTDWPFKINRNKFVINLLDLGFENPLETDFIITMVAPSALKILKTTTGNESEKLYKKLLSINVEKIAEHQFSENQSLRDLMILMGNGFKIRAALMMEDIASASNLYENNISQLQNLFHKNLLLDKNNSINKFIDSGLIISAITPYFEYSIFMKDFKSSKVFLDRAASVSSLEISKLGDETYLEENESSLKDKNNNLINLLLQYYEAIGDREMLANARLTRSYLISESYKSPEVYLGKLSKAVASDNLDHMNFYLKIFKENLWKMTQEIDYPIYFEVYELLERYTLEYEAYITNNKADKPSKDEVFLSYLELFELDFFLVRDSVSIADNFSALNTLFDLSEKFGKDDKSYIYAQIYVELVKQSLFAIDNNNVLKEKFKKSREVDLEKIIKFFLDHDYLTDAVDAISLYKEQKFLNYLERDDDIVRRLPNVDLDRQSKISQKIKLLIAELDLLERRSQSAPSDEINQKVNKLKSLLKEEISASYKTLNSPTISNSAGEAKKIDLKFKLSEREAFVDFFVSENSINIVFSDIDKTTKISQKIDLKDFSKLISSLYFSYSQADIQSINALSGKVYEILFYPLENFLINSNISNVYVRGNSFISSLPFQHLIKSHAPRNISLNIIYRGIGSTESKKFELSDKSSLFAVTKKFNNLLPLAFAGSEVEYIYDVYKNKFERKNNAKKYLNEEFTILNLRNEFSTESKVIHIASHYSPDRKFGGLLLGTGNLISAKQLWNEIPRSDNFRLVTLSACEAGLFNDDGQSIEDLPNVFLGKGVGFVIATLWKISDKATADFMRLFYEILLITRDPVNALTLTQVSFSDGNFSKLEKKFKIDERFNTTYLSSLKSYQNPFYWAGFQIITSR